MLMTGVYGRVIQFTPRLGYGFVEVRQQNLKVKEKFEKHKLKTLKQKIEKKFSLMFLNFSFNVFKPLFSVMSIQATEFSCIKHGSHTIVNAFYTCKNTFVRNKTNT